MPEPYHIIGIVGTITIFAITGKTEIVPNPVELGVKLFNFYAGMIKEAIGILCKLLTPSNDA